METATTSSSTGTTTGCSSAHRPTLVAAALLWERVRQAVFDVDAPGDYVVADRSNAGVVKCPSSSPGADCAVVVSGVDPVHIRVLPSGDYLITDCLNHRVLRCLASSGSTCTTVAGGTGAGSGSAQLNNPFAAAVDANGDNIIADDSNHRVQLCSAASLGSNCTTVAWHGRRSGAPRRPALRTRAPRRPVPRTRAPRRP